MYGRDASWVVDPPDVRGAGEFEYASVIGIPNAHPLVGGADWGPDQSGMQPDWGMSRIVTGSDTMAGAPADARTRAQLDDWRDMLNFRHSPTPWILLGLLVAVGFIHLRVNTRVGPAHGHLGLG